MIPTYFPKTQKRDEYNIWPPESQGQYNSTTVFLEDDMPKVNTRKQRTRHCVIPGGSGYYIRCSDVLVASQYHPRLFTGNIPLKIRKVLESNASTKPVYY